MTIRYYLVRADHPKDERGYIRHVNIRLIATSFRDALEYAECMLPGCTIWSIAHHGKVDAISSAARQEFGTMP